jgi:sugar (pentulose or hexulose) kinase
MSRRYLMALDAGTGAGRCFLVSLDGQHAIDAYEEWSYDFPPEAQPGGAQFDASVFWDLFTRLIRQALAKGDLAPDQIAAVSSTSQREGIVLLDANGRELYAGPNIDLRRPTDADTFTRTYGELLHGISGHWPFPMFAPYRLLWFKEHRPDLYERVDKMLLLNDWLLYRLSGEHGTEPSNGNETLLFDLKKRQWAWDVIDELGFPRHFFPPVLESGRQLGAVSEAAAGQTGLLPGTPVVMGGGDTQAALLGTGAITPGDVGVVLGTYGPQQLVLDRPVIAEPEYAWSGCHVVPDRWVLESTSMETGQAFRWVRDIFYAAGGQNVYAEMSADAAASPPGARGVLAYTGPRLPNYRNLQFVGPGGFKTQLPPAPASASRGDFARATLESVACAVYANARRLERITGQAVANLRVSGGLSQSETLVSIMASLSEVPVYVPVLKEGSALGAAICAGVGSGQYASFAEGVETLVSWEAQVEPESGLTAFYREHFERWMQHYPAMYGEDTPLI